MSLRILNCCLAAAALWTCGTVVAETKTDDSSARKAAVQSASDENRARIEAALAANVAETQYLDTQLGDVLNDLRQKCGVDFELDVQALTADGKGTESIINHTSANSTLGPLLNRILGEHGLTWVIADEAIVVTTKDGEKKFLETRVYPVADFADADGKVDYDELTAMIKQAVAPRSWVTPTSGNFYADTSGDATIARVTAKKALVVTQTYRNQQAIAALLKQFRGN